MSESEAKAHLDPEGGEGSTGFVSASDIKDAIGVIYDDMATSGVNGPITIEDGPTLSSGTGIPNGNIEAPVGSVYFQTDSAFGVTSWRKKTGSGDTGWIIKDSTPALEGVSATNMNHWRDKLATVSQGTGTARIMCMGTSNLYGWASADPEDNAMPFRLAKSLNARGIPAVKFSEPTNTFSCEISGSRSYMAVSGSWYFTYDTAIADAGSIKLNPSASGDFTYSHPDCEYFVLTVRDWSNTFQVKVDSGSPSTITNTNTSVPKEVVIDAGSRGAHTLTVNSVSGSDELAVYAVGGGIDNGVLVSNYGVPGSTSTDWRKDTGNNWGSLNSTILLYQPDLVIYVIGGGNEVSASISTATYKSNLEYTFDYIQDNSDANIIVTGPVWSTGYDDYKTAAYEAAANYGVVTFDIWKALEGVSENYEASDHLNEEAQTIWAREIARAITEL